MNDTILQDSLKVTNQVLGQSSTQGSSINIWMWVAFAEFLIIAFLILRNKLKPKESILKKFKEDSLKDNIDFSNILTSSFHSIQLYDELKVKCHPDRFPGDKEKNAIAESLFQEINKNQRNRK